MRRRVLFYFLRGVIFSVLHIPIQQTGKEWAQDKERKFEENHLQSLGWTLGSETSVTLLGDIWKRENMAVAPVLQWSEDRVH